MTTNKTTSPQGDLGTIQCNNYGTRNTVNCLNLRHFGTSLFILLLLGTSEVQSLDYDDASCLCETSSHFDKPFVVLWNSPTEGCHVNFSVNIDFGTYGILSNTNQTWDGEVITVFYNGQLGLYPSYDEKNKSYNGGLPQRVNISEHLVQAVEDIDTKIPDPNFNGIAVIDWEMWRPIWETNFGAKQVYKIKSIELVEKERGLEKDVGKKKTDVLKKNKLKKDDLKKKKDGIVQEAKRQFESAARKLMEETIMLGRKIRPRALWGFYNFPGCYGNLTRGYTCGEMNKRWNDRLLWLYNSSTALFPSIYLREEHRENNKFVKEKLTEAFRFFMVNNETRLPVFPYLRPLYTTTVKQFKMLNEDDLENTIGQSADMGSAGLILWGNHYDERTSKAVCQKYNHYVHKKLGPYITSLTEELEWCSKDHCHSNGRCIEDQNMTNKLLNTETCSVSHTGRATFNTWPGKAVSQYNVTGDSHKANNTLSSRQSNKELMAVLNDISHGNKKPTETYSGNQTKLGQDIRTMSNNSNTSRHFLLTKQIISRINILENNSTSNQTKLMKQKLSEKNERTKSNNDTLLVHSDNRSKLFNHTTRRQNIYGDLLTKKAASISAPKTTNKTSKFDHKGRNEHATKKGFTAAATEETAVRIPSVYIILITVTLGGALLMTVIYVAIYYAVNVRGRHDHTYENNFGPGEDNPFSIDDHDGPWWNEKIDQKEKLLNKSNE